MNEMLNKIFFKNCSLKNEGKREREKERKSERFKSRKKSSMKPLEAR